MTGRRQNTRRAAQASNGAQRRIAGPTSALTDYLAANNISATDIARNARNRQQQSLTDAVTAESSAAAATPPHNSRSRATPRSAPSTSAQGSGLPNGLPAGLSSASSVAVMAADLKASVYEKTLNKTEQKQIELYKTTDNFRQAKRHWKGDAETDDTLARMFYFAAKKMTGQFENCSSCQKRFTVTNYTLSNPDGPGLLCTPCGKNIKAYEEEGPKLKKQKTSGGVGKRRQTQNRILDGLDPFGAPSLVQLCIERLSRSIDQAEDLGLLPEKVMDRIARILSKRRQINSTTLKLFLQPGTRILNLYDGAKLSCQDFLEIFQQLSSLQRIKVKNGIQFKSEVMEYLTTRDIALESLRLSGSNLITDEAWTNFLAKKGKHLKCLSVSFTDNYFSNAAVKRVAQYCTDLLSLKIKYNQKVDNAAFEHIQKLKSLEHLSLRLTATIDSPVYVSLLDAVGSRLRTFSLRDVPGLNDTVLHALHRNCRSLAKLRITKAGKLTDDAFVRLFTSWESPPLRRVDLSQCCLGTAGRAGENPEKNGLCDGGFTALMEHSGRKLEHLSVESCHHISRNAFADVFSQDKTYPCLETLDVSFCDVDDFVVASIYRSCPAIRIVKVFGDMKVKQVDVPRGKVLIGVPTAAGMRIEGTH